jgi:hypothetical protein
VDIENRSNWRCGGPHSRFGDVMWFRAIGDVVESRANLQRESEAGRRATRSPIVLSKVLTNFLLTEVLHQFFVVQYLCVLTHNRRCEPGGHSAKRAWKKSLDDVTDHQIDAFVLNLLLNLPELLASLAGKVATELVIDGQFQFSPSQFEILLRIRRLGQRFVKRNDFAVVLFPREASTRFHCAISPTPN